MPITRFGTVSFLTLACPKLIIRHWKKLHWHCFVPNAKANFQPRSKFTNMKSHAWGSTRSCLSTDVLITLHWTFPTELSPPESGQLTYIPTNLRIRCGTNWRFHNLWWRLLSSSDIKDLLNHAFLFWIPLKPPYMCPQMIAMSQNDNRFNLTTKHLEMIEEFPYQFCIKICYIL